MARFHDVTPNVGAVGAKLVYADDTLQHAGLYFSRLGPGGLWDNRHYFKGLGRDVAAAELASRSPHTTATTHDFAVIQLLCP